MESDTSTEDLRQALKASQAQFSALVDNVADAIVIVDADGIVEVYNPAAEALFGFPPDEIEGQKASLLMTSFEAARFDAYVDKLKNYSADAMEDITTEVVMGRKDGTSVLTHRKLTEIEGGQKRLFMAIFQDLTHRPPSTDDLHIVADYDTLTELHNFNYLTLELNRVRARMIREQSKPCALIYFNIDNFSQINDDLGFEVGDDLLIGLGAAFKQRLRNSDMAARLSADEFAILIYDTTNELAEYTATQFHKFIRSQEIRTGDKEIKFTCSVGICVIDKSCASVDDIFNHAIAACRDAKKAGGDCLRMSKGCQG